LNAAGSHEGHTNSEDSSDLGIEVIRLCENDGLILCVGELGLELIGGVETIDTGEDEMPA
jgi:hypothetical protein